MCSFGQSPRSAASNRGGCPRRWGFPEEAGTSGNAPTHNRFSPSGRSRTRVFRGKIRGSPRVCLAFCERRPALFPSKTNPNFLHFRRDRHWQSRSGSPPTPGTLPPDPRRNGVRHVAPGGGSASRRPSDECRPLESVGAASALSRSPSSRSDVRDADKAADKMG